MDLLIKESELLMNDITQSIHSYLHDFDITYEETVALAERYKKLKSSGEELLNRARNDIMPHLSSVSNDHQALCSKASQLRSIHEILDHLIAYNQAVKDLEGIYASLNCQTESANLSSVENTWMQFPILEKVLDLNKLSKSFPSEMPMEQINVFNEINSAKINVCDNLRIFLNNVWKRHVVLSSVSDSTAHDQSLVAYLNIHLRPKHLENLLQILHALHSATFNLQKLCDQIWKQLISPAIENFTNCQIDSSVDSNQFLSLKLTECDMTRNFCTPLNVLPRLCGSLEMLYNQLLVLNLDDSTTVMDCIRHCFVDKVIPAIVQHLMSRCLPANESELTEYEDVAEEAISFEQSCVEYGFAHSTENRLSRYVGNISQLFEDYEEQSLLSKGRALLQENIYQTVKLYQSSGESSKYFQIALEMPFCQVSLSVVKLKDMVNDILSRSGEQTSLTAYNLFSLYLNVVPCFYKNDLENIPLMAALNLNNCNYLAYHCLFTKSRGLSDLTLQSQKENKFDGLSALLKREGTKLFLEQFNRQKSLLISECLSSVNKFREASSQSGKINCKRASKQLIHQIKSLCRVWSVLPEKNFFNAIGSLIRFVFVHILQLILDLEDITASDSETLSLMLDDLRFGLMPIFLPAFKTEVLSGSELTTLNNDIDNEEDIKIAELNAENLVKAWCKLKEVRFVLNNSLVAIDDRWCNGKGILSHHLSVNELKHLIKALFQASEPRAAFLARLC